MHAAAASESLSCVQLIVTAWTVACQAPLSVGILQAGLLEWVAVLSSGQDRACVSYISCIGRQVFFVLPLVPAGKPFRYMHIDNCYVFLVN